MEATGSKNYARLRVSVIIPSYNHIKYVKAAIDSVLNQTHPNVELIVIDDGSVDGSKELLEKLAFDLNFQLITQENRGVCASLNRAIREAATGDFIALLASDDIWTPNKISYQMSCLSLNTDSEFCYSRAVSFFDTPDDARGNSFPRKLLQGRVLNKVFFRQHIPAGTILFSRRIFDILNGFDETLNEEDWDFVIRCASVTSFVGSPEPLLYYRDHDSNIMKLRSRKNIFHQKIQLLSKNFLLVPSHIWMISVVIHYVHDIVFGGILDVVRRFRA